MAVFLVNNCKFRGCSQKYSSLRELIQHIETQHIASDPQVLEKQELQQPSSLALSYVLRLSVSEAATAAKLQHVRQRKNSLSPVPSLSSYRSSTPTGSEFDEEDHQSDNSDDSWVTQEDVTSEIILGMMSSHKELDTDKPFVCPVPGCKKRYKNINGIKYHAKHGHRKDIRVKKPFRCKCGKSYSSASGLRHHTIVSHAPKPSHKHTTGAVLTPQPAPPQKITPAPLVSTPKHPALPLGSLTFKTASGDIQVAVPVSQVLTLPGLENSKRGLSHVTGTNWNHVTESLSMTDSGHVTGGLSTVDCGHVTEGSSLGIVGCYESVETFNGLDNSVDETKAD